MTVPVQTTVAFVGDPGEPVPEVVLPPVVPKKVGSRAAQRGAIASGGAPGIERRLPTVSVTPAPSTAAAPPVAPSVAEPQLFRISPRAAKLAKESVIDPTPIVGTGPSGRIVERDVKAVS